MRSAARLTYEEVQAARDGDHVVRGRLGELWPRISELYGVYQVLAAARARRGALDLDLPETKIQLGVDGRIDAISLRERNDAHRLIEECMIAANVEAGRLPRRRQIATLYRVHAGPDPDKFEDLRLMLQSLGCKVTAQAATRTRDLNRILRSLAGRPDYPMLATAVLRTMSQAVYQPANIGHFGLALPVYTHFTSPIRRYPDLLVHRSIGHVIDALKPGAFGYDQEALELLGKVCSERERRADEAARHVEARYKCAFVKNRIGEVLDGVVTGVTHFGIFVLLRDVNVDGLVHVSALRNDYYHLRDGGRRLVGERSGRSFGLGDELRVRVDRVNVDEAKIDLSLPAESGGEATGRRHQPARHPRRASGRRRRG
jgi:ribonuclease R